MVEHSRSDSEHLGSRLEFETLVSDLSSRFVNLPAGEVDREITDALRLVCEFLGIDFAVLWQWPGGASNVIVPTHMYNAREGLQPPEPLSHKLFPWFVKQLLAGRMVALSFLEELPAEAAVDRESAHLLGIKSNLTSLAKRRDMPAHQQVRSHPPADARSRSGHPGHRPGHRPGNPRGQWGRNNTRLPSMPGCAGRPRGPSFGRQE